MPATRTRPIATIRKMSSQNESQHTQATTYKPAAQAKISEKTPEKRQRVHAQVASTDRQREESPKNDHEALRQAKLLVAAEEERNVKRVRDAEIDIKRIDNQHAALKKSHDDHAAAVEARQIAIKTSISQLEDDLKLRPTSIDVHKIVDTEREARQHALNEHVAKLPGRVAEPMNTILRDFQNTKLKSMITAELASTQGRIDNAESSLDTVRKAVISLNSIVGDKSDMAEAKQQIIAEVKREITEASGKMSVKFTTQLNTRIEQSTFNVETVAIPHALEPLRAKIDQISGTCNSIEENLATFTQLQQKHGKDGEWRYKELENTFRPTQHLHTRKLEQLNREVQILQKDLHTERESLLAECRKTSTLETSMKVLQDELHVEREARKQTTFSNEVILRKLNDLEEGLVAAKEAQNAFDFRCKQLGAHTAATLLAQERTFRTQLTEHERAANTNTARVREDIQLKMAQQEVDVTNYFDRVFNARHVEALCNRVEKLEATIPSEVANIEKAANSRAELVTLKETVIGIAASTSNLGKHVDNIRPMLIDIAELKDQHRDHIASCKAQILEQVRITKAQAKNTETMLKGCITNQEIALRSHLFEALDIIKKPAAAEQRTQSNIPSMSRHERRKQTALAVRVLRHAKRIDRVSSTVHVLKSDFDRLKSCVAEDVQNVESKMDTLKKQHDDLQTQQTQMNIRVANIEAAGCKRSARRESSQQPPQAS